MRFALAIVILLNLASWVAFRALHRDPNALISATERMSDGDMQAGVSVAQANAMVAVAWGLALVVLIIAFLIGMKERPWPRLLLTLACAVQAAPLIWVYVVTH